MVHVRYILIIMVLLGLCVVLGRGWADRDRIIKDKNHVITVLTTREHETKQVTEEITRKPDGTVIVKRNKVVERTKVLAEKTDKVKESTIKEPVKTNANLSKYSLAIEFRGIGLRSLADHMERFRQPAIVVGYRLFESPIWAEAGYDIYDRSVTAGIRVEGF